MKIVASVFVQIWNERTETHFRANFGANFPLMSSPWPVVYDEVGSTGALEIDILVGLPWMSTPLLETRTLYVPVNRHDVKLYD